MPAHVLNNHFFNLKGYRTVDDSLTGTKLISWWPATSSVRYIPGPGEPPIFITDPNALRLLSDVLGMEDTAYP